MENKFKIKAGKPENTSNTPPVESTTSGGGDSMFSGIEKRLKLESYFEEGFPVQYLPKIIFVLVLAILYISNTHYAEKTVRDINAIQAEVEDMRADYTTLKSDLMFASKQSEVARKVKDFGLKESLTPPYKIVVEKGEY
ncbi:MAG TPA: FtsL-like putative cell division protein [Ohtaekwangia sp.]|uniref:FtsL-like putative cell division protein n=1 Tax=Ohtaekwangia sp. TaxID=2066019 RepID=UPI002F93042C